MDLRTTFATSTGSFLLLGGGVWKELRDGGPSSEFSEVTRTSEFVELYDADREMKVRLYESVGMWYDPSQREWVEWPNSQGAWK